MGNEASRNYLWKDKREYVFTPLVEHEDEVQARIAEAFHFPSTPKPASDKKTEAPISHSPLQVGGAPLEDGLGKPEELRVYRKQSIARKLTGCGFLALDPRYNSKRAGGWSIVVHELSSEDTLAGLSLRYGVSTDIIRRANFMSDDRLVSHVRLLVPTKNVDSVPEQYGVDDDQAEDEIQSAFDTPAHRKRLTQLLTQLDPSHLGSFAAEYYLEQNDFNLRNAMKDVDADCSWELQHSNKVPEWASSPSKELPLDFLSG